MVTADLEDGREVRNEMLKLVEESPEYANYEKDVDFEISMLKRRYLLSGEAMTPSRRSQMQAHMHQVQLALMKQHAEKAADNFLESLSKDEKALLQSMFLRLEARKVSTDPALNTRTVNMDGLMKQLTDVCDKFVAKASAELQKADAQAAGSAAKQPTAPDAAPAADAADVPDLSGMFGIPQQEDGGPDAVRVTRGRRRGRL